MLLDSPFTHGTAIDDAYQEASLPQGVTRARLKQIAAKHNCRDVARLHNRLRRGNHYAVGWIVNEHDGAIRLSGHHYLSGDREGKTLIRSRHGDKMFG